MLHAAAAPIAPATLMTLMTTLPAHAAGAGAELARPSSEALDTARSAAPAVKSAVQSAPNVLQSANIDQAVNTVVDVVKVRQGVLHDQCGLLLLCPVQHNMSAAQITR